MTAQNTTKRKTDKSTKNKEKDLQIESQELINKVTEPIMKELDEDIKKVNKVTKETPKLKRFASHEEAFNYFLKYIHYYIWMWSDSYNAHKVLPMRLQRQWLKHIFLQISGTTKPCWDVIIHELNLITDKKSTLSRNKRDFIDEVYNWVDHFVAKEGEPVTAGEEDTAIPYDNLQAAMAYADKQIKENTDILNQLKQ